MSGLDIDTRSEIYSLRNPDVRAKWLASACSKRPRPDSLKAELQRRRMERRSSCGPSIFPAFKIPSDTVQDV